MTAEAPVRFHTCPVCRREICQTQSWYPLFTRHNTTTGDWCPMSGRPIPEWDGS